MGNIPIYVYFSLAVPEALAVFYVVFAFTKVNWSKKEYLIFSLIYAILTYGVRMLPISFGVHTILLICIISGLVSFYYKIKLSSPLLGMALVFTLMALTEVITAYLFTNVFLVNLNIIFENPLFWLLTGVPHIVFLFFCGYLINTIRR